MSKAYLFGQVLGTHSFYLRKGFPVAGEYSEIEEKYFLPGGETGTCATVLDSLGVNVKIDGTHIGTEVEPMLKEFYKNKNVDLSSLFFEGILCHGRLPLYKYINVYINDSRSSLLLCSIPR